MRVSLVFFFWMTGGQAEMGQFTCVRMCMCVCLHPPPPHLTAHTVVHTCSHSGQKHESMYRRRVTKKDSYKTSKTVVTARELHTQDLKPDHCTHLHCHHMSCVHPSPPHLAVCSASSKHSGGKGCPCHITHHTAEVKGEHGLPGRNWQTGDEQQGRIVPILCMLQYTPALLLLIIIMFSSSICISIAIIIIIIIILIST